MQVKYRMFMQGRGTPEAVLQDAATFATSIGQERLINVAVAALTSEYIAVYVWYWDGEVG